MSIHMGVHVVMALAAASSMALPSWVYASCISDTPWSNPTQVYEQIPVYIRAPESENDPACDNDVRRVGYSIFDFEQQVLLFISRVNEMMGDKPILTYGGRVCLSPMGIEMGVPLQPGDDMYPTIWDQQTGGKPLGIEILVPPCHIELEGTAVTNYVEYACGVAHGWVRFTAYHDDGGNICPRPDPSANADEEDEIISITPACVATDGGVEGDPCVEGDPDVACMCHDGNNGQDYAAWHKCDFKVSKYSPCQCWGRGYERHSLGVGRDAPFEPAACDALGDVNTKDILTTLLHEGGHALGMKHSEFTTAKCEEYDGFTVGLNQAAGVMNSGLETGGLLPRWLRGSIYSENEIGGFQAMYGFGNGPLFGEGTGWDNAWIPVFYESTDGGATWSAVQSFGDAAEDAATRVAISATAVDAMSPSREFQAFAWATREGKILHAVRDADGFHDLGEDAELVGSTATTFYPPAVAVGEDRLIIAWLYKNPAYHQALAAELYWWVRGLEADDVMGWQQRSSSGIGEDQVYHRQLEVGYDATTDLFVLVSLTQGDAMVRGSQLRVIETADNNPVDRYPLIDNDAPQAVDFSAPVCFFDATAMASRCTIVFNQILLSGVTLSSISWTPGGGGTDVEYADLDETAIGSFELVTTEGGTDFFGMFGTNGEPDGFRFLTAGRFAESGLLQGPPSVTPLPAGWFTDPMNPHRLPSLGSRMTQAGDLVLTAVGVDTLQADGTREPSECELEPASSSGGSVGPGGGDEDDDAGEEGEEGSEGASGGGSGTSEGCSCTTDDNGSKAAALFVLTLMGGMRLRRRPIRPRSARA